VVCVGRLETWVGSRLPKHLNNKKVEIVSCRCFSVFMFRGHFLTVIVMSGSLRDTSSTRWELRRNGIGNATRSSRVRSHMAGERRDGVAACRDRAPPKSRHPSHETGISGGSTVLLMRLREVHEEYWERIRGRN
jgi:hypothetical protein